MFIYTLEVKKTIKLIVPTKIVDELNKSLLKSCFCFFRRKTIEFSMAFESLPWVYIHFALSRSPQHEFPAPRPPWLLWDHLACWLDTEAGLWWPNSLELFHRSLVTAERLTKTHHAWHGDSLLFFNGSFAEKQLIRRNNNKVGCEILFQRLMPNFEMMMKWLEYDGWKTIPPNYIVLNIAKRERRPRKLPSQIRCRRELTPVAHL